MLFGVKYRPRDSRNDEDSRRLRLLLMAWQPPKGVAVQAHYHFVSGGGLVVVETDSATSLYEGFGPFKSFVDFDIEPVVNIFQAIATSMDIDEWSHSVLSDGKAEGH